MSLQTFPQREGVHASAEGGHDAPITTAQEDCLNAARTARAIHRFIRSSPVGWSTRIGLYGTWGSGKTSILNLLGELEKDQGSIVVRFSAWSAHGESGVLRILYDELVREFSTKGISIPKVGAAKKLAEKGRWIPSLLRKAPKGSDTALGLPEGTSAVAAGLAEFGFGWFKIGRKDIESMVSSLGERRVIVFIDDLDRADPKAIPKSLLALRELLDWPRFTFVLAFDKRMVAMALGEYSVAYGEQAELFLEKVIDVGFEVPVPAEAERAALARVAFRACAPFVPLDVLEALRNHLPPEPRRIKSVARKIGVLSTVGGRHDPAELDWLALTLFNIVHEVSSQMADAIVSMASQSGENWELFFGNRGERAERLKQIRLRLEPHIASRPEAEKERVLNTAVVLLDRWAYTGAEQIRYLVDLVSDEPPFTRAEVAVLVSDWSKQDSESLIRRAIADAAARSGTPEVEAAASMITLALDAYGGYLQTMSEAETEVKRWAALESASEQLAFLEHVWTAKGPEAMLGGRKNTGLVGALVGLVSRWSGWRKNEGESGLRDREIVLALSAAENCDEPEKVYAGTDPFRESHHDGRDSPAARWRAAVRSRLLPRICDSLLGKFLIPEGMLTPARGEDELATWMLESPKSPIYTEVELVKRLLETLGRSDLDEASIHVLRDNAKLYLHMLLFQARDSSWAGSDGLREIAARHPAIAPTAWRAVVACRVPFRMVSSLLKLKADLISAGVPEEGLVNPDWLLAAAGELKQEK